MEPIGSMKRLRPRDCDVVDTLSPQRGPRDRFVSCRPHLARLLSPWLLDLSRNRSSRRLIVDLADAIAML